MDNKVKLEERSMSYLLQLFGQIEEESGPELEELLTTSSLPELKAAICYEISRRCYLNYKIPKIDIGQDIWYSDNGKDGFEHGVVFDIDYRDHKIDTIFVQFDNGDADEFFGEALGTHLFLKLPE